MATGKPNKKPTTKRLKVKNYEWMPIGLTESSGHTVIRTAKMPPIPVQGGRN